MSNDNSSPAVRRLPDDEFVQLFTRAQRPLFLFILSQTGNADIAEEVLQEANVILWAKRDQFEPETNFDAWARRIATYEVLKQRQRKRRNKVQFSDDFLQAVAAEFEAQVPQWERRRDALRKCLEKLGADDRELIQVRYQPGVSGKELAQMLGRPANSVYQSLGRIRRILLDCVQRRLASEGV